MKGYAIVASTGAWEPDRVDSVWTKEELALQRVEELNAAERSDYRRWQVNEFALDQPKQDIN